MNKSGTIGLILILWNLNLQNEFDLLSLLL
jgi:hypothetical protein